MLSSLGRYRPVVAIAGIGGSIAVVAIGLFVFHFVVFGELMSEIPVGPQPNMTPVALKGGTRLQLSLHSSKLASGNCNQMTADVELLRGTTALFTYHDSLYSSTADDGDAPLGSTSTLSTIDVPREGIDAIRTSYRFTPAGCDGEVKGLVLQLRKPRL